MAKERIELWRGQKAEAMKAQLMGVSKGGEKPQSFNGRDQQVLSDLEQRHNQFTTGKPSTQEKMAQRMREADEAIKERIAQSMTEDDDDQQQAYIDRIVAFDRRLGLMPEKPRSQVERVAAAIKQEFNLDKEKSANSTTNITTVNPEVLLTSATKDLLKTLSPENLLLTPMALALIVVRAMRPEVKQAVKRFYDKIPVRFRLGLILVIATAILAACNSVSSTPTKEANPGGNNNDPQAGEQTGLPSEATTEGATEQATKEAATEEATQDPDYQINLKVTPEVNESIDQNPLLQNLSEEDREKIPLACVDFAKKLKEGRDGDSFIDVNSSDNVFSVIVNGTDTICQVVLKDGTTILDIWNDQGPLYLTTSGASDALGTEVTQVSTDGYHGNLADAYDSEGRRVGGINLRVLKWETVDETGNLPSVSNPESVLPTPINPGPEAYEVTSAANLDPEEIEASIKKIAIAYADGNITDEQIQAMSFEHQKLFSIALDAEKDVRRGEQSVIRTDESGKKTYLGEDGKFHPEKQTIDNTLPRVVDKEGYTHIFYEGQWIRIEDSQNIQFNNFDTFPWPQTELTKVLDEKDKHPLTMPEWMFKVSDGSQMSMVPVIILSKEVGEFNIVNWGDTGTLTAYIPNENDLYSVRRATVIGNTTLFADDVAARSTGEIDELSTFWQKLEENTVYYLVIFTDQKSGIAKTYPDTKGKEITAAYQGFAPTSQTTDIMTGKIKSEGVILIDTHTFVKKLGD